MAHLHLQLQGPGRQIAEAADGRVRQRNLLFGAAVKHLNDGSASRVKLLLALQVFGFVGQLAHPEAGQGRLCDLDEDRYREALHDQRVDGVAVLHRIVDIRDILIRDPLPCLILGVQLEAGQVQFFTGQVAVLRRRRYNGELSDDRLANIHLEHLRLASIEDRRQGVALLIGGTFDTYFLIGHRDLLKIAVIKNGADTATSRINAFASDQAVQILG